jgi:hypothetical protein
MRRKLFAGLLPPALLLALAALPSCKGTGPGRPYREPPPPGLTPTTIDYADSDGFDALLETALTNQDPAIMVRTSYEKPDWGPRLNAWIAAWNRGGTVGPPGRAVRMQAPLLPGVNVDGDSIREFRLLIESLMDRVEDLAGKGSSWYAEERTRSRRVALLKPYNLRFHVDEDRHIQLIFFNGDYSQLYPEFMISIAAANAEEPAHWSRTFECSRCKGRRGGVGLDRLTGHNAGE